MSFPVHLIGRLGADPEARACASTMIVKLRVVTNGRKREQDGSWVDVDTSWWDVTCFGKTAEAVADACRKGQLVALSGKVKIRTWDDEKGEKRSRPEIIADQVAIVVRPGDGAPKMKPVDHDDPWTSQSADTEPPF